MRVALHTLGCKVNQAETSQIASSFRQAGFCQVPFGSASDVVVINCCSVTAEADRECRQLIRRALRCSPQAFVVVTGCYAQLKPEEVASIDGVDLVLGTAEKARTVELAADFRKRDVPFVAVSDAATLSDFGAGFTHVGDGRTRAFLKVQDGCDYNCSFCTIPRARGPSRSLAVASAVQQASRLVERGFREIVLTGVNLGDYGRRDGASLLTLIDALHAVGGLRRLKISSIEPNLLSDALIDRLGDSDRLMPHLHLPLQSGSDETLARMRRRYRSALYRERCAALVARRPDVAIGADVIVGFPGETEVDFAQTVSFLDSLPIAYLHVFTYSERSDTPAAIMGTAVPRGERKRRTHVLRAWSRKRRAAHARRHQSSIRPVLFERVDETGRALGWTDNYIRVAVPAAGEHLGRIADVRLGDWTGQSCEASLADSDAKQRLTRSAATA